MTKRQLSLIIGRERKICELAIRQLEDKLRVFEEKYRLSSDVFYERFQEGIMGDEQDFFEWKALFEGVQACENGAQRFFAKPRPVLNDNRGSLIISYLM